MTTTRSAAEIAEKLSRRRSRILMFQALLFLVWQGSFYAWGSDDGAGALRTVDQVKLSAWVVWVCALVFVMATGGGFIHSREVRRLLNDEVAQDNRRRGQQAGFFAAILAGVAVYGVNQYMEPIGTLDAIHAILTAGVGAAILRYGLLERRAERGV